MQTFYTILAVVVISFAYLVMIALALWSLATLWCTMNSDIIERHRRIRECQKEWKEKNDFEEDCYD